MESADMGEEKECPTLGNDDIRLKNAVKRLHQKAETLFSRQSKDKSAVGLATEAPDPLTNEPC